MDRHAGSEYMNAMRKRYLCVASRQEKSRILDQYCANTGQNRKYTTRKIRPSKRQAPRSVTYLASLEGSVGDGTTYGSVTLLNDLTRR